MGWILLFRIAMASLALAAAYQSPFNAGRAGGRSSTPQQQQQHHSATGGAAARRPRAMRRIDTSLDALVDDFADSVSEGLGKGVQSRTERVKMMQKALEMWWRMGEVGEGQNPSTLCKDCKGCGTRECRFCSGHGLIRAGGGDAMACPICKTRGVEACDACHGAGRIAVWMR